MAAAPSRAGSGYRERRWSAAKPGSLDYTAATALIKVTAERAGDLKTLAPLARAWGAAAGAALVAGNRLDFSGNRIPGLRAYEEQSYWRDLGTIETCFASHQDVVGRRPRFDTINSAGRSTPAT